MPMRNYCLKMVKQRLFRTNFSVRTRILVRVFRLKAKIKYVKFLQIIHVNNQLKNDYNLMFWDDFFSGKTWWTISILFLVHIDTLESNHSSGNNSSSCARHSRIFNSWSDRKSCFSWGTQSTMHYENFLPFFLTVSSDSRHNEKCSWSNEFCSESVYI